jgi:hypothetical protein
MQSLLRGRVESQPLYQNRRLQGFPVKHPSLQSTGVQTAALPSILGK